MSVELLRWPIGLTRFLGSKERGICYQITTDEQSKCDKCGELYYHRCVSMTKREALDVALAILKDFRNSKYGSED